MDNFIALQYEYDRLLKRMEEVTHQQTLSQLRVILHQIRCAMDEEIYNMHHK